MEGDMDTSGFYKVAEDQLLYGPNTVMGADLELLRDEHDSYRYPVAGWYWFDSEEDATVFFELPLTDGGAE
jgi:hypothetical protein